MTTPATATEDPGRSLAATLDDPHFRASQEGWRRRIAASWRLPPADCGHRDPLFDGPPSEPLPVDYCCATVGLDEAAALARLRRSCSPTSCARLRGAPC